MLYASGEERNILEHSTEIVWSAGVRKGKRDFVCTGGGWVSKRDPRPDCSLSDAINTLITGMN